jgi:plasmid stability protein
MTSLTVRNLDKKTKDGLRIRAALHGRSMEEEVRQILKDAAKARPVAGAKRGAKPENMYDLIRRHIEPLGGVDLKLPPRSKANRAARFDE